MLTRSLLDDEDVESERQVILEELAMDDDSPDDVAMRTLARQLFGDHGLGRDTAGERSTVRSISGGDIRDFFATHYRTGNTTVAIAGDVDHDETAAAVAAAFAEMPGGDGRVRRAAPGRRSPTSPSTTTPSRSTWRSAAGRWPARTPTVRHLDIVNHIFGGGLSSRLFDEIRERRGLAYSVYSALSSYADAGAWSVYAGAMPEHAGRSAG